MTLSAPLDPEVAQALPCYNRPAQWQDTVDARELRHAALMCQLHCSQLVWCEQQRLLSVELDGTALGVWAGKVWSERDYRPRRNRNHAP